MKALKYLSISILPITVYFAFTNKGWLTFLPMITFFGLVPFMELFFAPNKENFSKEEEQKEKQNQ